MVLLVKELKEIIADIPDDTRIVLPSDAEGNGYRWAYSADFDGVVVTDDYEPEIYSSEWDATEADMDEEEWQEYLSKPKVLVISP